VGAPGTPVDAGAHGGTGAGAFCPGCGRPRGDCPGCAGPSDPWRYCPSCGRWLAVQVTPAGWAATCRGCGAEHRGTHR
jgi:hypothetical protein